MCPISAYAWWISVPVQMRVQMSFDYLYIAVVWTIFQQGVSNARWFGTLINHINLLWIFLIIAVHIEWAASTVAMHLFLSMEPPQELSV